MALSATVVLEVRTTGSDTNGGGYKSDAGTTDYSQQAAAELAVVDAVTNGTTTITSATGGFTAAMVGNVLYIQGGTGSIAAGWYEIATRSDTNTITVDRSAGLTTGTGATLNVGGALASPGQAAGIAVASNTIWVKAGTYTITTTSPNVAGGIVVATAGASDTAVTIWEGYNSARGDLGTAPLMIADGVITNAILFSLANFVRLANLSVDGNNRTGIEGLAANGTAIPYKLRFANFVDFATNQGTMVNVYFENCTANPAAILDGGRYAFIEAKNCGPLRIKSGVVAWGLVYGGTSHGFVAAGNLAQFYNTTTYGNAGDGINLDGSRQATCVNCYSEGNTGEGFGTDGTYDNALINCGGHNNTGGNYNAANIRIVENFVAITDGSAFTNAGAEDFSLNATALRGALLRAAGFNDFPSGNSSGAEDIGAVQHADPAGGGGGCNRIIGG